MLRRYSMFVVLVVLTVVVSACAPQAASSGGSVPVTGHTSAPVPAYGGGGASQASSPTQAPSSGSGSSASTAAAQVAIAQGASLGSILVDSKGMTLYLYTKDTQNSGASTCYGKCATFWPPLATSGAPSAGSGLDASKLGTITRTDGTTQVTYNGWPLYYYAKDKQAGDVTGQKVGGVWFVVSPAGDAIQ